MTQVLAKSEPTNLLAEVRRNPIQAISEQYEQLSAVANVTFPMSAVDNIPPMMRPAPSVIHVSQDPKSKDTYYISKDSYGLSKHTIFKMLAAAGVQARTTKLTPDSDIETIRWTAVVWRRLPNGSFQTSQGSKAWSWERCQADFIRKATDKPYDNETPDQARQRGMRNALQYREFADEQTETKALLRAARAILNIKTAYGPEELKKPFLFLSIVPDLDMSDPEIRRMTAQKAIDATYTLYGIPGEVPVLPPSNVAPPPAEADEAEFREDAEVEEPEEPDAEAAQEDPAEASARAEQADAGLWRPEDEPPVEAAQQALDMDPFAEPDQDGPPTCACGNVISENTFGGKRYTSSQIVDITIAKTGKAMCTHCYMAWLAEQRKAAKK